MNRSFERAEEIVTAWAPFIPSKADRQVQALYWRLVENWCAIAKANARLAPDQSRPSETLRAFVLRQPVGFIFETGFAVSNAQGA